MCKNSFKNLLSLPSHSMFSSFDAYRIKYDEMGKRVLKGLTVSLKDYEALLDDWVYCSDGSRIEDKKQAKSFICLYLTYLKFSQLDLSGLSLKSIPPLFYLSNLTSLNLSRNNLSYCDPLTFVGNSSLSFLRLDSNKFSTFDEKSFISTDSLLFLSIEHNHFTVLKNHYFKAIPSLVTLRLGSNNISEVEADAFLNLSVLQRIVLSRNCISTFSKDFFMQFSMLKHLDLSHNNFESFDCLSMESCRYHIDLTGNPLRSECSLRLLVLSFLDSFKEARLIFSLTIEQFLDSKSEGYLSNNFLHYASWKDYFFRLFSWLELDEGTSVSNKRVVINKIFEHLCTRSDELNLRALGLHSVPPLIRLNHLLDLNLSSNVISFFDFDVFPEPSSLRSVNLSSNRLIELQPTASKRWSDLHDLNLSNNLLNVLNDTFFSRLINLKMLNLKYNDLQVIGDDSLTNQTCLTHINLEGNFLTFLSPYSFRHLVKLQSLNLANNRLSLFEWFSMNSAQPQINLMMNLFSLDTIATMNATQNSIGYSGPSYLFSVVQACRPIANIHFDSFAETLSLWGRQDVTQKWKNILEEKSESSRNLYNNFNIFLNRLYNDICRKSDGSLPEQVKNHVDIILRTLEAYDFDTELWHVVCNQAFNAVSDCVDRIGIVLVWLSIYLQRYDAEKKGVSEKILFFDKQLSIFDKVIDFVDNVDNCVIVFDRASEKFKWLSDLMSDGVFLLSENRKVQYEECNLGKRQCVVTCLNDQGAQLQFFNVGDQVEDVFLIINSLRENGLSEMETISMMFGRIATLRNYLTSVIQFFSQSS